MIRRTATATRTPPATPPRATTLPDEAPVTDLLHQLVACLPETPIPDTPIPPDDHAVEAVLDVELDGYRYTLLRHLPTPLQDAIRLSPREQEIVRLVAEGLPNKAIACILEVSPWTIATHLRRIFAKLEVNSRAEMIARAAEKGVLKIR
jgi:DNA-binding CsgD family transcriptional regulator